MSQPGPPIVSRKMPCGIVAPAPSLVIPEHFGHDLARGVNTNVQLLVDGTDSNTAKLVQGYCRTNHTRLRRQTCGRLAR